MAPETLIQFIEFDVPLVSPEMDIPVVEQFDLQLAYRQEAYSDFEGAGVPRVAFGWVVDDIKIRGSQQDTFDSKPYHNK